LYYSFRCNNYPIRRFDVAKVKAKVLEGQTMSVKNNGLEFQISDNEGKHVGHLRVAKRGVFWRPGKTRRGNELRVDWNAIGEIFAEYGKR
jgi:hypothetical protein